ncbi:MAG: PAS domain-containing protein, partial [Proteobacteria bacterium]|nr:PAS domain-containing protein [Pseudomonadota bacterium]
MSTALPPSRPRVAIGHDPEAEIEALYRNAPLGLCLFDRDLRYVRCNDRLAELTGTPAADRLGRTVGEIVPYLAGQAEPVLRRVLETGVPAVGVETVVEPTAPGGVRRVWISDLLPVTTSDGRVLGVQAIVREVTEER